MQLFKNIEVIDKAIYLKEHDVLVLSDFHLGFEESLNKKGVFVPRFQLKDIFQSLKNIFEKVYPKIIVVNGDLKHEFGRISEQEWRDVLKLIDFLKKHCEELVVIKGNHDTILKPIAEKRLITLVPEFRTADIIIVHGDKLQEFDKSIKTIIIGHEHPAVGLRESGRVEKFKCFLVGKYKKQALIVQPSFNPLLEGTDILKERVLSPFLTDISNFNVFVVNEKTKEILKFGKTKGMYELRQVLLSSEDTVPIDEAIRRAKKKWQPNIFKLTLANK